MVDSSKRVGQATRPEYDRVIQGGRSKLGMAPLLAPLFGRSGLLWEVREIDISTRDRRGTLISIPFLGLSLPCGGSKKKKSNGEHSKNHVNHAVDRPKKHVV